MSGKARRASNRRFQEYWNHWWFQENEVNAAVLKVDWIRGQFTVLEQSWLDYEGKVITEKIPMQDIRQWIRDSCFPHQAKCVWVDSETGEPINEREQRKLERYKRERRYGYRS